MSLEALQALARDHVVPAYARQPVEFVRGEGARLWDADGVEYLDFQTGLAVTSRRPRPPARRRGDPRAGRAADPRRQPVLHRAAMRLAERLAERSLGGKVHFANSGHRGQRGRAQDGAQGQAGRQRHLRRTAASTAAPTARCARRRRRPSRRRSPRWCPASSRSSRPPRRSPPRSTSRPPRVILEPVQGESGVYELGPEVLRAAREACDVHGAALIFDEVQCGLGRTGTLWAYEHTGVVPDLHDGRQGAGRRPADRRARHRRRARRRLRARRPRLDLRRRPGAVRRRPGRARRSSPTPRCWRRCATWASACATAPPTCRASTEVRGRGLMLALELDPARAEPATDLVGRALREQRLVLNATGRRPCACCRR